MKSLAVTKTTLLILITCPWRWCSKMYQLQGFCRVMVHKSVAHFNVATVWQKLVCKRCASNYLAQLRL